MKYIAIFIGALLSASCATGPIPQNGNDFIAISPSHSFLIKTDRKTVEKSYSSVIRSITPFAKQCLTGTGSTRTTTRIIVIDGVKTVAKLRATSKESSQLTIQVINLAAPIKGAPVDGSYELVANIASAAAGKTKLDIYFVRTLAGVKDKIIDVANGKSISC